jgi:hypothetical protein
MVFSISAVSALTAQKAEVLYFKANLACCHARACATGCSVMCKSILEANFDCKRDRIYKTGAAGEIRLIVQLIEKHNARSQTVVLVVQKRRGETVVDLSDLVRQYPAHQTTEPNF